MRLGVRPGGCAGMKYDAVIDDEMEATDQVVYESAPLRVVADSSTVQYLDGLNIDYSDDLVQSGFVLSNPNVQKSCGCGASFGEGGGGCGSGGCG